MGALKLKDMSSHVGDKLKITIVNDGSNGKLNEKCGADFVKINQKSPSGTELSSLLLRLRLRKLSN